MLTEEATVPHKPTIETAAPEGTKTRKCSQCGEYKPLPHFSHLPLDHRCDVCLPPSTEAAMVLYDKRVDLAQRKMAQIFDASERSNLEPLERLVKGIYDAWGGPHAFSEDLANWIKNLADAGDWNKAVRAGLELLKIHGKVDKMKQEEEWQAMDDENVKEVLKLKLANMIANEMFEDQGKGIIDSLIGKEEE